MTTLTKFRAYWRGWLDAYREIRKYGSAEAAIFARLTRDIPESQKATFPASELDLEEHPR